jgi:hypothetical protein
MPYLLLIDMALKVNFFLVCLKYQRARKKVDEVSLVRLKKLIECKRHGENDPVGPDQKVKL